MRPVDFEQSNRTLNPPEGIDYECDSIRIWSDNKQCVSCWTGTWFERLSFLFSGKIWIRVASGSSQPPMALATFPPFD